MCIRDSTNIPGSYTVTYDVQDAAGNSATQVTRTVDVSNQANDTNPPVISLIGQGTISVVENTPYTDAGATATDDVDGDISPNITTGGTYPGNTTTPGVYTITYDVQDNAGNQATQIVRSITVTGSIGSDTTPPVITLLGSTPVTIDQFSTYADAGATATDDVDGNLTANINTNNPVNVNVVGTYTVTYDVSDLAGNSATQVTRTVNVNAVADTTPPVITLVGSNPQDITIGASYNELGATATDNIDGDLTANIAIDASSVNTLVLGSYTVTYDVTDLAGNNATQVTRTVNVTATADTTAPVLSYTGANPITIIEGTTYTPPAVTATDNIDGIITANIIQTGDTVDPSTPGTYTLTYDVRDAAGNNAQPLTITVTVTAAPTSDGDGVDDTVENNAPNAGDGNNDGQLDSGQANVASILNSNTTDANDYITLATTNASATIATFTTVPESSLTTQDEDYEYPLGLIDFTITTTPGATETITIHLDQLYDTTAWEWRKYQNNTYQALTGVTFATDTVAGQTVTTVSYQVTDGGANDADGIANGTIVDPTGPGINGTGTSDSGGNLANTGSVALYATVAGMSIVTIAAGLIKLNKGWVSYRR